MISDGNSAIPQEALWNLEAQERQNSGSVQVQKSLEKAC